MNRRVSIYVLLGVLAFVGISCLNDEPQFNPYAQFQKDSADIETHLLNNNISFVKDPSGIFMVIDSLGGGLPAPWWGDPEVTVGYQGHVFSNNASLGKDTITRNFRGLIAGWGIVLSKLPVGSIARAYIPSYYGYGNSGTPTVPANSILVFDLFFESVTITKAVKDRRVSDIAAIDEYLTANSITAQADTTGIRVVVQEEGTGDSLGIYDRSFMTVSYKSLADSTEFRSFDSAAVRPIDLPMGVMRAVQYHLKKGARARVYVPSGLGFGPSVVPAVAATQNSPALPEIPANSILMVDIKLHE